MERADHDRIAGLLSAVRARPTELPLVELAAIRRAGLDVDLERHGDQTVVVVASRADARLERLTRREREVAALMAAGLSNRAIATELYVSVATVKDHVHAILTKTGLASRAQLIAAWYGGLDGPTDG